MKKKLSTFVLAFLVATSLVGCSKEEVAPADTSPTLVEEVADTPDTDIDATTTTDDDSYLIEHKDNQAINSMNADTDEEGEEAEGEETDGEDADGEEVDTDEVVDADEEGEVVELEPIVDEDFSYYGHLWTQPEDQVNYKITISNTGDEAVTFNIYYGTSEFEHQVTVSSMAEKTVRVANALPGEHNLEFDTEEVDLSGTIKIWVSDNEF